MEELFGVVIALGFALLPIYFIVRNFLKVRTLEQDVAHLKKRILSLERSQMLASGDIAASETTQQKGFAAHQLSTLIDLETLKEEVKGEERIKGEEGIKDESTPHESLITQAPSTNHPSTKNPSPKPPSKTSREWEAFVGGRLFNRIGAAAIILGIGFFLKYAFENDIIPEWLRVVMGVLAGAGLILGAVQARKRTLEIFAQGLTGAGMGTLYLSVYASYNFYHLVSIPVAFGGMIAVTALGFVLALRFDSLAIALISWFGGFITPLLFHTQTPNVFGLFAYLLFLNLGMLALVLMRDAWFVIKPLSFVNTFGIAFLWYLDKYTTLEHFALATTFAVLYWALFFGVDLYRSVQGLSRNDALWRKCDSLLNSTVSYGALFALVYDAARAWMPLVTILFAAAYFLAAQLVRSRQVEHTFAFRRYIFSAIVYLFIATAQHFSREWLIIAWSLEMVVICYLAWRVHEKFVMFVMLVAAALVWASLIHFENSFIEHSAPFRILTFAAYIVIVASFLAIALMVERLEVGGQQLFTLKNADGTRRFIGNYVHYAWGIQGAQMLGYVHRCLFEQYTLNDVLYAAVIPVNDYTNAAIHIVWAMLYLVLLSWIARRQTWHETTHLSLINLLLFLALVPLGFSYNPATEWQFLLNSRVMMLVVGIASVAVLMRLWDEGNKTIPKLLRPYIRLILPAFGFLLVFSLLSGEASDYWHSQIMRLYDLPEGDTRAIPIANLENAKQLTLSLVWLGYAIALMAIGLMRRVREIRLAALGLAGLAVGKIFLYDLSYLTTPYRIGSFIGLGIVLMLVSYLYQRYKDIILDEG
jgi:uncharacterized membrane protein